MASPFRATYEYVINSWVPVSGNVVDGQQQQQQQQQQPQQLQQSQQPQQPLAPPVPPCVMMQPCYVPSQQPACPPKQQTFNNNGAPTYSATYRASTFLPEQSSPYQSPNCPACSGSSYSRAPSYPACPPPSYPAAQSSVYLAGPPPAQSAPYPAEPPQAYPSAPGQSQMYVMTPIDSISTGASSARNASCNAKRTSSVLRCKRRPTRECQIRTRTVSCTATLPRKGKGKAQPRSSQRCASSRPAEKSWICVNAANSDSNSDCGSVEESAPAQPRRYTHVHLNIRKAPRPPKKAARPADKAGSSFICKTMPADDDDASCSSGPTCSDDDQWSNCDDNHTNNNNLSTVPAFRNRPEGPNCSDHTSCYHFAVTTLVPKKSSQPTSKKTLATSHRAPWLENSNNSNNNRYRPKLRNSELYLEEEARRIGGKMAMDAMPGTSMSRDMTSNVGRDMTSNVGREWDSGERGVSRQKRRLIIPRTSNDYGILNPIQWLNRYQTVDGSNADIHHSNSEVSGYAINNSAGAISNNGDYDDSASFDQLSYASKPGRARRINSRDASMNSMIRLAGSEVYMNEDKLVQTGIAMQISVFVTAVCYSLHLGCLTLLRNDLLKDTATYQQIEHSVSVLQFLASYLFGRYCDISGLYTAFFVTYLTSALSYSLLSLAQDDYLIFASQIIRVFVHNIEVGQIAICQMASAENRVVMLGKVALANGLGMKLGGIFADLIIGRFGVHDLSLILSGVQCAGLLILLLTNLHGQFDRPTYQERTLEKMFSAQWIHELLSSPRLLHLLMAQFCTSLAVYVFQGAFPQMAVSYFHMSKDQLGMCLTYIALVTLVTQAIGVSLVVAAIREDALALTLSMSLTLIYFVMILVPNMLHIWVLMFPLSVAVTLLNLILTSALSTCGPPNSIGSTLGLNMMVVLLSKAMAPIFISAVTSDSNFVDVAILGLACSGVTCLLLFHENHMRQSS